jgi:sugar transferase EpsL
LTPWALSRGKRALDLVLAIPASLALFPMATGVALGIRLRLGRPVLFRQERVGLNERIFTLYKFRSMRDADPAAKMTDEERLTPFGRLLRKTSVDELPQLMNVILGSMSLVGPRPLLADRLPHYDAQQRRRHRVLPGITGWQQINGRNRTPWKQRLGQDIWYVDNAGIVLDLRILLRTVGVVLSQKDALRTT